jgi:hypothetical protein
VHGVLTCLPTAAAVQDLQRLFYKILNCGLSHENEPPSIPLFNLVAPHIDKKDISSHLDDLTWLNLALLWVMKMYLRALFTYLFFSLSRTGHPTPKPTPWVLCLCYT